MFSSLSSEPRRRRKEYDRDRDRERDSPKSKDKDRHRSSRTSRKTSSSSKDRDRDSVGRERSQRSSSQTRSGRKMAAVVPEMERRASTSSPSASKTSLPYPTFSKAHSKEAVAGREDVVSPKVSLYTPDPTDLGHEEQDGSAAQKVAPTANGAAPPSPPLTTMQSDSRRPGSGQGVQSASDHLGGETENERRSGGSGARATGAPWTTTSGSSLRRNIGTEHSPATSGNRLSTSGSTKRKAVPKAVSMEDSSAVSSDARFREEHSSATDSGDASTVTQSTGDSEATSIAPDRKAPRKPPVLVSNPDSSPASVVDSSPRTPTPHETSFSNVELDRKGTPVVDIFVSREASPQPVASAYAGPSLAHPPPPPPPPPPPVSVPADVPRVDYLLQNGGLPQPVPRNLLLAATPNPPITAYQQHASSRMSGPHVPDVQNIFAPYQALLDAYSRVMGKNGSIAVATGYRSVARRLLDRLEAVFARNISSETCQCVLCQLDPQSQLNIEEYTGVSWGEILEYVSGRRELPRWPPFSIATETPGLGISASEPQTPMQKLDIDVPEEYREHYVRQSKKTKQAVQAWLSSQPEMPSSPPQEVDDETLIFAIMTHLEPEKRQLFTALLRGVATLPSSRAPTPMDGSKPELIAKTALALQRLYRLADSPRDAECALYLLKNPSLHGVLATLAAVSSGEWDILVSGRFDGFLWSGAESTHFAPPTFSSPSYSRGPSRGPAATPASRTTTPFSAGGPSRGTTPFGPFRSGTPSHNPAFAASRGPTPAPSSFGAPVQMDEETEIAALAEVEREIYLGMEALEDAFETLHNKAESVRRALRERSAGLAIAAQARRGSEFEGVEVLRGTPASGVGWNGERWEVETDDGIDDLRSELAPDDSASNISFNRRRRPERRTERRTPAPVEEEDEGSVLTEGSRRKR